MTIKARKAANASEDAMLINANKRLTTVVAAIAYSGRCVRSST